MRRTPLLYTLLAQRRALQTAGDAVVQGALSRRMAAAWTAEIAQQLSHLPHWEDNLTRLCPIYVTLSRAERLLILDEFYMGSPGSCMDSSGILWLRPSFAPGARRNR